MPVWIAHVDPVPAERIRRSLAADGWEVHLPRHWSDAAARRGPALLLLDWRFARDDLGGIASRCRETGVSLLVAGGEGDIPRGVLALALEAGADDCIRIDGDDRILSARLLAHARRLVGAAQPRVGAAHAWPPARRGTMRLDESRRAAWVRTGREAWRFKKLSLREFGLLRVLAERQGAVLDRAYLLDAVWGMKAAGIYPGTVDKYVQRLRRKLGRTRIRTRYGLGYALV